MTATKRDEILKLKALGIFQQFENGELLPFNQNERVRPVVEAMREEREFFASLQGIGGRAALRKEYKRIRRQRRRTAPADVGGNDGPIGASKADGTAAASLRSQHESASSPSRRRQIHRV
jgi:hypothetical protein